MSEWVTPVSTVLCTAVTVIVTVSIFFHKLSKDSAVKTARIEQKCRDLEAYLIRALENNKSYGDKTYETINHRLEKVEISIEKLREQQSDQYNRLQDRINSAVNNISKGGKQ